MFKNFKPTISLIWLWYVWLPLAHAFAKAWFDVTWFDISEPRLKELREWKDSTNEIEWDELTILSKIKFTSNPEDLKLCNFHIVTVPTPIDKFKNPDLTPVIKATESVARNLQKGSIIVYESTVYPWVTEEICLPIIEKITWFKYLTEFKLWYSPERINPWDKEHTITKIKKVVSWSDDESLEIINNIYSSIIIAWTFKASSIKVAEAAKVIENTQRDINIALINELSIIFDRIWINTFDVLEAAWTKWNFLKFSPGLVWWHCIWVDPYYLVQKAVELWYHPQVITAWRRINDWMWVFVANQIVKLLIKAWIKVEWAKVLVLWLTFKENVPDFRNSRISDTIKELKEFWIKIEWYDPYYSSLNNHILEELNLSENEVISTIWENYDWVIYWVNHKEFDMLDLSRLIKESWIIFDVKWKLKNKWLKNYKSL